MVRLFFAILLSVAAYSQQSGIFNGTTQRLSNSTSTVRSGDYRVEFRIHNFAPTQTFGDYIVDLDWLGMYATIETTGNVTCASDRDSLTPQSIGTNFGSGKTDLIFRIQRVAAENRLYCEVWEVGTTEYASLSKVITGSAPWANGSNVASSIAANTGATGTTFYTGRVDYMRVFSTTLPLQSKPSWQNTTLGDLASWELEGDATARLTDSSGLGKTLTASGTPTYAASLTGTPVSSPRGDNATIFSQAPLKAGQSNTLGNWSICRNNAPCSSYFWTQTGGPSTLSWSSRTSATPTVTGAVATTGTDYTIRLVTTDSSGAIGTTDLALGAVAVDSNNIVIIPNENVRNLLGTSGMIRFGSNPWVYEDYAEDLRLRQIAGWMGLDPTIAADYHLDKYWDTAQTGTVYVANSSTAVTGVGTSFQTVFSCAPGTANTANVSAGTQLTWASGPTYTAGLVGTRIVVAGIDQNVISYTDSTHITVSGFYGTLSGQTTQIRDVITLWYPRTDATIGRRDAQISTCSSDTSLTLVSNWTRPTITVGNAVQFSRAAYGSTGSTWGSDGNNFYDNTKALYTMAYRTGLKYYWDAAKEFFYRFYTVPYWDQMEALLINDGQPPRAYAAAGLFIGYFTNPEMVPGTFLTRMGLMMDRIITSTAYSEPFNDGREMAYQVSDLQMGAKWAEPSGSRAAWQARVDSLIQVKFPATVMPDGSYPNDSTYSSDILFNVTNGNSVVTRQSGSNIPSSFCDTPTYSDGTVSFSGSPLRTMTRTGGTSWSAGTGGYQIEVYGTGLSGEDATFRSYVDVQNSSSVITTAHTYTGSNTTGLSYRIISPSAYVPMVFGTATGVSDDQSYSCTWNSNDQITLTRPYGGTTRTGASAVGYWHFFLPAKSSLPFHNGGIIIEAMNYIRLFSSNSTTATEAAAIQQTLSDYILNYGYWPATKGAYYGVNSPGCVPDPTKQAGCAGLIRSDADNNVWSPGANRDFAVNFFGPMGYAYVISPSAPKLAMLDDLYTGSFANMGYGTPTQGDGSLAGIYSISGSNLNYNARNGKTSGEPFGIGNSSAWPAARLGGIAPLATATKSIKARLADISGAASIVVDFLAADGTLTTSAACTSAACSISADTRQGYQYRVRYLSAGAATLATGSYAPVQ